MIGYYGFDNAALSSYLGIPIQEVQRLQQVLPEFSGMVQQSGIPQSEIDQDYALLQRYAGESGGGPMGGANRLDNILAGLNYLAGHPEGSKHHGFNPTDLIGNLATYGLYGAGKGLVNAAQGNTGAGFNEAINSPGIGGTIRESGNAIEPGLGTGLALKANLAGAGAGLGAMVFGGGAAAGGAGGENFVPYEGAYTAQPFTEATGQWLPFAGNFTDVPFTPGAAGAAGAGSSLLGPAAGAFLANQAAGLFAPGGGGGGEGPMATAPRLGQSTALPQKPAGAPSGSELDTPGAGYIDPAYIKRQKGGKNSRGISDQGDLSQQQNDARMASLYGFSGGMA